MTQEIAILDIGSGRVSVLIGNRGLNNTICLRGSGECEYAGYGDGEWYRPEELSEAVGRAVADAEAMSRAKINKLFIGVPGQFTITECREVSLPLSRKRKITDADIQELLREGCDFSDQPDYSLINMQPVTFFLGDGRRVMQPEGMVSSQLSAFVSYILAEKSFISTFDGIMTELGIESAEYVSALVAQSLFLFDEETRDRFAVLIDVGNIVTDIALVRGDGLLRQFSMSIGGGHISKDLSEYLSIRFSLAESIKRRVMLNIDYDVTDTYDVNVNDRIMSFSAKQVNDVVKVRLNKLAKLIKHCLAACDFPQGTPYYLTGGGVCYITGARDYLAKKLGKNIEIAAPNIPKYNQPHRASALGLLDMVLSQPEPEQKKSLFDKLFGR